MHMDAILRITAIVLANADATLRTNKYDLVDDIQNEFPRIAREELLELVQRSITIIGPRPVCFSSISAQAIVRH